MIRACIIGCGKIADSHALAIGMTPNAEIVGVCDREELMARQLADRFQVKRHFKAIHEMLEAVRPDVVHITTPPQSHFEIGKYCLEAGCHAYIEKPFTVDSHEAEELIRLAEAKKLKLTVGNDEQFSPVAIQMRNLINRGYLGGSPVHMDAYHCYDLGDERFARAFLSDKAHWVRKLPGQLMHNIISHGIVKIVEYLPADNVNVIAHGFTSGFLNRIGEDELIDELRVIISDDLKTTAYFTFSTQMRPPLMELRIFGPTNGLLLDQDHHSLIRMPGRSHKSYLQKIIPLNDFAKQYRRNLFTNIKLFMRREFHMQQGLRNLISLFYISILEDSAVPIPYRNILLTTRIMDEIFAQVYG